MLKLKTLRVEINSVLCSVQIMEFESLYTNSDE